MLLLTALWPGWRIQLYYVTPVTVSSTNRVEVGLEPIPAVKGQEAGYATDGLPSITRRS